MRKLLISLALVTATSVQAETLTTSAARDYGAWRMAVMENTDTGRSFCAAETLSVFDQILRVALYPDDAFLEIRDVSWAYPNGEPMRFNLITGSQTRTVTGQGWNGAMSFDLLDEATRTALFDHLTQNGPVMDLRLANRSRLAQFPLDGAEAALEAAQTCWRALQAGESYTP